MMERPTETTLPDNDRESNDHAAENVAALRASFREKAVAAAEETYLSTEEVSRMRQEKRFLHNHKGWTYDNGEKPVTLVKMPMDIDRLSDGEIQKIVDRMKRKGDGEKEICETVIVNALRVQASIEKRFGLPDGSLCKGMKMNYMAPSGKSMMTNNAEINMATLADHVDSLRAHGMSDNAISTELAGHVFHESVHMLSDKSELREALTEGRDAVGEVTSITAQLAFYFSEGFSGVTSFGEKNSARGREKIRKGDTNTVDYDVATFVGASLLAEELRTAMPGANAPDPDPFIGCRQIMKDLSPKERISVIPALKKAIAKASDTDDINRIFAMHDDKKNAA